jgi:hypothetical protein
MECDTEYPVPDRCWSSALPRNASRSCRDRGRTPCDGAWLRGTLAEAGCASSSLENHRTRDDLCRARPHG